ncbi:hypothetical protein [Plasmodium yoelii yoelii]|uniref:Uncharacterized protein n=1 Tax=Plasmodium yoelii yoelii TaxID=73239 RepID=Q7R8L4_PLAYO|nr:hypothetical protein [Plasmodium yoelii yoelii]
MFYNLYFGYFNYEKMDKACIKKYNFLLFFGGVNKIRFFFPTPVIKHEKLIFEENPLKEIK